MIWETQAEAVGAGSSWKRVSSLVGGAHKEMLLRHLVYGTTAHN